MPPKRHIPPARQTKYNQLVQRFLNLLRKYAGRQGLPRQFLASLLDIAHEAADEHINLGLGFSVLLDVTLSDSAFDSNGMSLLFNNAAYATLLHFLAPGRNTQAPPDLARIRPGTIPGDKWSGIYVDRFQSLLYSHSDRVKDRQPSCYHCSGRCVTVRPSGENWCVIAVDADGAPLRRGQCLNCIAEGRVCGDTKEESYRRSKDKSDSQPATENPESSTTPTEQLPPIIHATGLLNPSILYPTTLPPNANLNTLTRARQELAAAFDPRNSILPTPIANIPRHQWNLQTYLPNGIVDFEVTPIAGGPAQRDRQGNWYARSVDFMTGVPRLIRVHGPDDTWASYLQFGPAPSGLPAPNWFPANRRPQINGNAVADFWDRYWVLVQRGNDRPVPTRAHRGQTAADFGLPQGWTPFGSPQMSTRTPMRSVPSSPASPASPKVPSRDPSDWLDGNVPGNDGRPCAAQDGHSYYVVNNSLRAWLPNQSPAHWQSGRIPYHGGPPERAIDGRWYLVGPRGLRRAEDATPPQSPGNDTEMLSARLRSTSLVRAATEGARGQSGLPGSLLSSGLSPTQTFRTSAAAHGIRARRESSGSPTRSGRRRLFQGSPTGQTPPSKQAKTGKEAEEEGSNDEDDSL